MNLQELKKTFDAVVLRHHMKSADPKTVAAIVDGDNVFIGIAMCFVTDQFNRRVGRQIAIGRALRAYKRHSKDLPLREGEKKRDAANYTTLSYVCDADIGTVDEILKAEVFNEI